MQSPRNVAVIIRSLAAFPWRGTLVTLLERFREDRLGLTASSLTFTTTIALVPFITVALAVFSAFPMFGKLQFVLQKWLVESLVPDNIARQVLGYLTQFAGQASKLGTLGVLVLFATALALVLTIDRTLNNIWRVRQPRPLAQRLLVYCSAMTLGPLLLAASVTITSYAVSASKGLVGVLPGSVALLLEVIQYAMLTAGAAALYYYVPNTAVRWGHAWAGGLFVSTAMELAKKLLVLYLANVPTYSVVYGTFATLPILLVWIYLAWVIVLMGAVITAYLPSLRSGLVRRHLGAGWRFQIALQILQRLHRTPAETARGQTIEQLSRACQIGHLGIEQALEALLQFDWVARIGPQPGQSDARYVMRADPGTTPLAPMLQALLLHRAETTEPMWRNAHLDKLLLRDVL
ncbi:MAG: YihY family inner membrane protein [Rhodoferax sp.]|nr:YihY family inner membrane protein [Rhodoferax sp.]